ncbi:ferredoxin [bacterium]|nr:ferredoxin [bacterium]
MKPVIDETLCVSCGNCEDICPAVFHLMDGGTAQVIDPEGCDYNDCCEAAEENCPEDAISFED